MKQKKQKKQKQPDNEALFRGVRFKSEFSDEWMAFTPSILKWLIDHPADKVELRAKCSHPKTRIYCGEEICLDCCESIRVLSYRD